MNNTNLNLFFVFLFVLNICSAQKDNAIKAFDIETFNKNKDHLNRYTFITNDSTSVKQNRWQFGFEEIVTKKDNFISTYYKYYESGNLKIQGDFFPEDFEKGIWKEYDEQGKLIKETDYDAPYKFTWEDVLEFIKEHEIDMNGDHFIVSRNFGYGKENISDKEPFWSITHAYKNKDLLIVHIIDGLSGKILDKYDQDYPVDGEYDETLPDMENE